MNAKTNNPHQQFGDPEVIGYASRTHAEWTRSDVLTAVVLGVTILLLTPFAAPLITCCPGGERVDLVKSTLDRSNGSIATALKTYQLHTHHLPKSLADLTTRPAREPNWQGPYFEDPEKLLDPWSSPYHYRCPGAEGREFDLWSLGPDRRDGTEDDIINWPKK